MPDDQVRELAALHIQRLTANTERIEVLEERLSARMHSSDDVIADYLRRISALEKEVDRIHGIGALTHPAYYSADGRRPVLRVIRGGKFSGPTIIAFDPAPITERAASLRKRLRLRPVLGPAVAAVALIGALSWAHISGTASPAAPFSNRHHVAFVRRHARNEGSSLTEAARR